MIDKIDFRWVIYSSTMCLQYRYLKAGKWSKWKEPREVKASDVHGSVE